MWKHRPTGAPNQEPTIGKDEGKSLTPWVQGRAVLANSMPHNPISQPVSHNNAWGVRLPRTSDAR